MLKMYYLKLSSLDLNTKLPFKDLKKCDLYSEDKITKNSYKSLIREYEPLSLVHYHICEMDGCSNYTFVYLMKNKSKVIDMFRMFVTEIENKFSRKKM